jgi:hypothetical protein
MNKDKSLEKINYIKLLIFLTIFVVIVLSIILFAILPAIKEYRVAKGNFLKAESKIRAVENRLKDTEKEMNRIKEEHRKILSGFRHEFSKDEFIEFANRFFSKVSLTKSQKIDHKGEFVEYDINVTSSLKTPVNFYRFLEALNSYTNIIQADFPIDLSSDGKNITSSFKIVVYKNVSNNGHYKDE